MYETPRFMYGTPCSSSSVVSIEFPIAYMFLVFLPASDVTRVFSENVQSASQPALKKHKFA